MTSIKPKVIIIVSVIISTFILLFLAVYVYNVDKDLHVIETQINTENAEYEKIIAELHSYDEDVDVNTVKKEISYATEDGETVAKMQTEASKYFRQNVDPMSSEWADTYREKGDKKIIDWMDRHFPEATDTERVMPWTNWNCEWEFSPVFEYHGDRTRLSWTCRDKDDRLLALAYATYSPQKRSFTDLSIIYTKHAKQDNAYDDTSDIDQTQDESQQVEQEENDGEY